MAARKRKIINRRQLEVAEIWERDPEQTLDQIRVILESEFNIKVHKATVGRDLQALNERNLAKSDAIIETVKQQLATEYEFIYGEALTAWHKSLEDKQITTVENIEAEGGNASSRVKASERIEGQSGNPALLAQAQLALKSIRELYGLDMPQKLDASLNIGGKLVILPTQDG